jgi:hypothetical protein
MQRTNDHVSAEHEKTREAGKQSEKVLSSKMDEMGMKVDKLEMKFMQFLQEVMQLQEQKSMSGTLVSFGSSFQAPVDPAETYVQKLHRLSKVRITLPV